MYAKQNYNGLFGIMIFWREARYQMQPFSCRHRERHISKRNYEITVVQEIHVSRLKLHRRSLEFVISFQKYGICLGFGIEVWLIPFWDHVIQLWKVLNFLWKHSLSIIKYLFLSTSNVWVLDSDQAQINSVQKDKRLIQSLDFPQYI